MCEIITSAKQYDYDSVIQHLESVFLFMLAAIICGIGSFMAALWYRAGHYIFALWFLSFFLYFPRLISEAADWMSTILQHMVWP